MFNQRDMDIIPFIKDLLLPTSAPMHPSMKHEHASLESLLFSPISDAESVEERIDLSQPLFDNSPLPHAAPSHNILNLHPPSITSAPMSTAVPAAPHSAAEVPPSHHNLLAQVVPPYNPPASSSAVAAAAAAAAPSNTNTMSPITMQKSRIPLRYRDPNDPAVIEAMRRKRQRNTEAARRSRIKKMQRMEALERQVAALEAENLKLRTKIEVMERERAETQNGFGPIPSPP
ncbi:uncharacterized protein VTP21DRAFT_10278 [Calcarisporiella thermophila]|uniref:uncharacterized protein n=1 Tax=Calcarisporiella thermophila TaxID=911321 RepID=UPI00374491D4